MDLVPLAGMLFSLLVVLIIAGSILLFPLMRQLGRLLGQRLDERKDGAIGGPDADELVRAVESLAAQVERLAERQAFTERLLESGRGTGRGQPNAATAAEPEPGERPRPGGESTP